MNTAILIMLLILVSAIILHDAFFHAPLSPFSDTEIEENSHD